MSKHIPSEQLPLHLTDFFNRPWIESFHARLRDECLNRELLLNLREARVVIEDFRVEYNQNRPRSKLGYLSPNQWMEKQTTSSPDCWPRSVRA